MTLLHPWLMSVALVFGAVCFALQLRRGRPWFGGWLIMTAILVLGVATGEPMWSRAGAGHVAVMVDLSASTRDAGYRDRATLDARVKQLLGSAPHQIFAFADTPRALPDGPTLADLPSDRTTFSPPPDADAVVVFTDGQFPLPDSAVQTFPIIDPALDRPTDASVQRLEPRDNARTLAAVFRNSGDDARHASLSNVHPTGDALVTPGELVVTRELPPAPVSVAVRLSPGDLWPENDTLDVYVPSPASTQRWWVTERANSPVPAAFRVLSPVQLGDNPIDWLPASVVVFDDVPPDALAPPALRAVAQFINNFGGSVVLINGAHSGPWTGGAFDALSPLSFTAPQPRTHWMLLVDASGSMAEPSGAQNFSRWDVATRAVAELVPTLPPRDALSVGSFNRDLSWWTTGRSVKQTVEEKIELPPRDLRPTGPTNLDAVLENLATQDAGPLPTQLLVVSDAQATFRDVNALAANLARNGVRVNLLDVSGKAEGTETGTETGTQLVLLVARTGGHVLRSARAQDWSRDVRTLAQMFQPDALETTPLNVRWRDTGPPALPRRQVDAWRKSWMKDGATALAEGTLSRGEQTDIKTENGVPALAEHGGTNDGVPRRSGRQSDASSSLPQTPAARWQVGAGNVTTLAFSPTPAEVKTLVDATASAPRDPRLRTTWETGSTLHVVVRAFNQTEFLNGLSLSLDVHDAENVSTDSKPVVIPQTAPGRYELDVPAPRRASVATVRVNGATVVERIPVAGRYAPEFDRIGIDREALKTLAQRTGGAVIDPSRATPIDFHWPVRSTSLAPPLAALAAGLLLAAVVVWRVEN